MSTPTPATTTKRPTRVVLVLEATRRGPAPPARRLARCLRALLRQFGLRCVRLEIPGCGGGEPGRTIETTGHAAEGAARG